MNRITTFCLVIMSLIIINNVNAQSPSFEKGGFHVDLGVNLAVYGTKSQWTATWSNADTSVTQTDTDTDGAASTIIPLSLEYGISDNIGLGLDIRYSNYFIDKKL